jgi:hypothetical protein
MNRDELLTRAMADPPQVFRWGTTAAIYPHEAEGGTWLAANEYGITLAVLNWDDVAKLVRVGKQKSRGLVIPALIASPGAVEVSETLRSHSLAGTLPFCLVGVFAREQEVREWRWDGQRLAQNRHSWSARHWFSSGRSDEAAQKQRGATFDAARKDADADSIDWLRRLHGSHVPEPGPFSVCVHRDDAATVSYSEVVCGRDEVSFSYQAGHPCGGGEFSQPVVLRLVAGVSRADA